MGVHHPHHLFELHLFITSAPPSNPHHHSLFVVVCLTLCPPTPDLKILLPPSLVHILLPHAQLHCNSVPKCRYRCSKQSTLVSCYLLLPGSSLTYLCHCVCVCVCSIACLYMGRQDVIQVLHVNTCNSSPPVVASLRRLPAHDWIFILK